MSEVVSLRFIDGPVIRSLRFIDGPVIRPMNP